MKGPLFSKETVSNGKHCLDSVLGSAASGINTEVGERMQWPFSYLKDGWEVGSIEGNILPGRRPPSSVCLQGSVCTRVLHETKVEKELLSSS